MTESRETVVVSKDLAALMPGFLANRAKELAALRAASADRDFETLRQAGHRMRGAAASYGFQRIAAIGREIENAAQALDAPAVAAQIEAYAQHLARLEVVYR